MDFNRGESPINLTYQRSRELRYRKETFKWGVISFFVVISIYFDIIQEGMSTLLHDSISIPAEWTEKAEILLMVIFGAKVVIDLVAIIRSCFIYTDVALTAKQKNLLAITDASDNSLTSSCQSLIFKQESSPNFMTSWLMSSNSFNLSSDSRYGYDLNVTPTSPSSRQYFKSYKSTPPQTYSPILHANHYEYPDSFEFNKIRLRKSINSSSDLDDGSITDEPSLLKYLKESGENMETSSFAYVAEPDKSQKSISRSLWNLGHNILDYSAQLRKYTYQLVSRLPQTSISHADSDPDFPNHMFGDEIWFRLGVSHNDLYIWTKNLRQWISLTILNRLAAEIESINETLRCMGSTDLQIGEVSLTTLRQVVLTKSQLIPSLTFLLPYLELTANQEYLVQRIKELAKGGCMSEFVWNGGSQFKGRPWSDHLPTDSAIIIHVFCTYFDSRLPPHPNYPDGKTFTSQCMVRSPDKPVLRKNSLYVYQTRLIPPHFKLVIGDEVWDLAKGRNNLFHCILLFLFHIKIKEKGMLGRVNLGLSGVNILWCLDTN